MARSPEKAIELEEMDDGAEEYGEHSHGEESLLMDDERKTTLKDGQSEKDPDTEDVSSITSGKEHSGSTFSIVQGRSKVVFVKDNVSGMYKCHLCPYETMHRSSMRSHYAVHSNARPYACDLCTYEAKRLCDLKKHKVLKHGKTLKSLRKNQWRGSLGSAALKKDQLDYNDMVGLDSSALQGMDRDHSKVMSRTRSGIPIEIVEDEDEDEDEDISFLGDSAFNNDSIHLLSNPVFPEANISANIDRILNTPSSSEHSTNQNSEDVQNSKRETDNNMIPADLVKTEPGEFVDYFSKRYFEGMSGADPGFDTNNTSVDERKESGYNSEQRSPCNRVEESRRTSSASSGQSSKMPKRQNISGSSLLNKSQSLTMAQHHNVDDYPSDHLSTSTNRNMPQLLYRGRQQSAENTAPSDTKSWKCPYCVIVFYDSALYFMHMGLHNGREPWKCNLCGTKYHDVYGFTSHFVNGHANSC